MLGLVAPWAKAWLTPLLVERAGAAMAPLATIGLALVLQWRPWRLAAVNGLLVAQHLGHVSRVVRPDAPVSGGANLALSNTLVAGFALAASWRRGAGAA